MSKIDKRLNIKIEKCEDCPYCRMTYHQATGGRWEDTSSFLCKKAHKHMRGDKKSIPQDCPLENEKEECKTCDGVKVVSSGEPNMFNCEMGGDCSEIEGWTEDDCKTCGKTVPCPECMPVANKYYLLWMRDNINMNKGYRKIEKLEERIKEKDKALNGFLEIQKWCKEINVKSYGSYQTALNERMEIAKKAVTEKISHAAIVRSDGILEIAKCHPEIIRRCPYGTCKDGSWMGFVTSTGRYVDRKESLKIAIEAGQINKDMDTIRQSGLISENIWADTDHIYSTEKGYYIPDPIKKELAYVLGQIINDLPKNKDWLDPALEKSAVAILEGIEEC